MAIFFYHPASSTKGQLLLLIYYFLLTIFAAQVLILFKWKWMSILYCTLYDFYQQMTSFPFINKPTIKTVRQSVRIYILSSSFFFYTKRNFNECIFQWNKSVIILKKISFRYWLNLGFSLFYNYKLACTIPKA